MPLLENESLEPEIHQTLTDSLVEAFVRNGALRVLEEDAADVVLRATVVDVREEPFTYADQADQFRITIVVRAACVDNRTKETLWEQRISGFGIFSATEDRSSARRSGIGDAAEMLAQDILDRTQVGGW